MTTWGLLGGSFDPPHMGHLLLGSWALATGEIDRLMLTPCHIHALQKSPTAEFGDRVAMVRALASEWPGRAEVTEIESTLGAPSRTLRTLHALSADRPEAGWRLIVGQDILPESRRWHRWEEVISVAPVLVAGRAGAPGPAQEVMLPDVSSTEVRRRLAAGEDVDKLLPAAALAVIERRGLYR